MDTKPFLEAAKTAARAAAERGAISLGQWLTGIVPTNVFRAATDGDILPLLIFTVLFVGWGLAIWSAGRGSRRGLAATFVLNGLVLLAVPLGWLFFY